MINNNEECDDLIVNDLPLSEWNGASLLDYAVGETEITNPYFLGVSRTNPILLQSMTGMRELQITIVFSGEDLHEAKMARSRFNSAVAGKSEIYIPDDGFWYTCICQGLGEEKLVGQGGGVGKVEATYTFSAVRHGQLISESINRIPESVPGIGVTFIEPRVFCISTMPRTDVRVTTTADAAATSFSILGATFGAVAKDDVICVDGFKKTVTINGANCSASMDWTTWTHFPDLVPGFNEMSAEYTAGGFNFVNTADILVEYVPAYI